MNSQSEMWRPVIGYEGRYEVSNQGNVNSLARTVTSKTNRTRAYPFRRLALAIANTGYPVVTLCKDGKTILKSVHRLVAQAFLPNPESLPFVNHIDGSRNNNHVANLEWCTQSQNMLHAGKLGRLSAPACLIKFGKDHHGARRTYVYDKQKTKLIGVYDTSRQAAQAFNLEERNVNAVCGGKRHSCGGLFFSRELLSELADGNAGNTHACVLDEAGNPVPA